MYSVVVVGGQRAIRQALRSQMEGSEGFQVVGEAADDVEARAMIQGVRPDVVIIDLDGPWMRGLSLLRDAALVCPQSKFVVFAHEVSPAWVARSMAAGAHALVDESIHAGVGLPGVVRAVLAGYSVFPDGAIELGRMRWRESGRPPGDGLCTLAACGLA